MSGGNVPAQLAPIFQAAGRAYNIPANVLAGISSVESNLGRNTGPSSAGAVGDMQFLPSTARALGINPNDPRSAIFGTAKYLTQLGYHQNPTRAIAAYNGGPGNPQYGYARQVLSEASRLGGQLGGGGGAVGGGMTPGGSVRIPAVTTGVLPALNVQVPTFDQAGFDKAQKGYVLGSFLGHQTNPFETKGGPKFSTGPSALSALYQKGVLSSKPPNRQDFEGLKTVQIAHQQLQQIAGTTLTFPSSPVGMGGGKTGYVNPIPGANIGRTDMGVDANLPAGHPIVAMGDSRVAGISPNWYRGQPYVLFQLTSGPAKGQYYYVAEAINPTVRPGQMVRAGQVVGTYNPNGTGLELGWGSPTPGRTLAQQQGNTGDASHGNSPAGKSFRNFLAGLH